MTSEADLTRQLGDHLRTLRKQKGLSLLEVEATSEKEFKASVLGAYERGERAISAARLARLAELYRLPFQAMVPADPATPDGLAGSATDGVAIDLARLDQQTAHEARTISRFVRRLQTQRRDWRGRVFRMRAEDATALACALDRSPGELVTLLDELGIRGY